MTAIWRGRQACHAFVALVHTEGCGGSVVPEYKDMQMGYLQHPKLRHTLLLEHGCEITHNSYFRGLLAERGLDASDFGWASIQLDGGIAAVMARISDFFRARLQDDSPPQRISAGLEALRIGLLTQGETPPGSVRALAELCQNCRVWAAAAWLHRTKTASSTRSLPRCWDCPIAWKRACPTAGFPRGRACMSCPIRAGIGRRPWRAWARAAWKSSSRMSMACPWAGHPLVPVLQVGAGGQAGELDADRADDAAQLLDLLVATMSGDYIPRHQVTGWQDFQVTRGRLGVSF